MNESDLLSRIHEIYTSCTKKEQYYLRKILEELSLYGYSDTYNNIWLSDYKEIPVSIDRFISDDMYLGKSTRNGDAIYPYWKKVLDDIFSAGNKYEEVVFTGATRIGKSSTAITAAAYMTYRLMCLRDPQLFYNKKEVSKFFIFFFNITKDLAKGVAFREYNDTLSESPWFQSHGTTSKSERDFFYIPEGGKIVVDYGSEAAHGLGAQIFLAVMDEANFARSGIKDVQKAKSRMLDTYNTITARIRGTFRLNGEVHGKLFCVSSKKSDSDFIEEYVNRQLAAGAGEHMYVSDAPQWEVLPESMFHNEKFTIAVGDRYKRGFVVSEESENNPVALNELESQGYKLLHPPIDMKTQFLADFDIALRDLAGISVPGSLSFITQASLTECIGSRHNPFFTDILTIGTKDSYSIEEFFHEDVIDNALKRMPMFIHMDLSLNTDRTGISGVVISGREDKKDDSGRTISVPKFSHIFSIAIQAPSGDKIAYQKILVFICWLRSRKFNICRISRDQFQSEYMAQLLEEQGFAVDKISLDRTPDGYIALRSVLMEHRVDMLDVKLLQDELVHLQRDSVTGRVDHLVGLSKDISDSFAGAIWNALKQPDAAINVPVKSVAHAISHVNGSRSRYGTDLPSMFSNLKKY